MSKVRVDADEWYPVYSMTSNETYGYEIAATAEQIARWTAAFAAFEAAQDEIGELYKQVHEVEVERRAREKAEREAVERAERERARQARREAAEVEQARRDAMWEKIRESGGVVYDADGNRIGIIQAERSGSLITPGFRLRPPD